ncbi:MAG: putative metal-binding motif-containing protein [Myxococcota bacterium]
MRRWVVAAFFLTGCSVLTSPNTTTRCDPDVPNPCPDGFVCQPDSIGAAVGRCVENASCIPTNDAGVEACNNVDDDCDGEIDEGLELIPEVCNGVNDDCDDAIDEGNDEDGSLMIEQHETFDRDGDGFNRCGTQGCGTPDGECEVDLTIADCDDMRDDINPDADELCDTIDHDCDGTAVPDAETPPSGPECRAPRDVVCESGEVCELATGCVPNSCATGRECRACNDGQACEGEVCVETVCDREVCELDGRFCDSSSPDCQDPRVNGSACNNDFECQSGFCAAGETLSLPIAGVCFDPCCNDATCPLGQFCFGPGTGARSCVAPTPPIIAATGRDAVGVGAHGSSCAGSGDCRSGLCTGGTCVSSCGAGSDCPGDCGISPRGLECVPSGSGANVCTENANCPDEPGMTGFCRYGRLDFFFGQGCFQTERATGSAPNRPYGSSCVNDYCRNLEECCSGIIDPLFGTCVFGSPQDGCDTGDCFGGRCTTSCCSDDRCPGVDVCRPQRAESTGDGTTFFPMYCVPPS